jgi:hypothetical protein
MDGKYTAHHDIRQNLGCILWITFFGGIGSIVHALRTLPAMQAWLLLVLGIDLIAVCIGIWYAKEWARWAAGVIAALWCLGKLVQVIQEVVKGRPAALFGLIGVALFGLLAWYAFLPSTRKSFADARELIARSRAPARPR